MTNTEPRRNQLTNVDAYLLQAWQRKAEHPDHYVPSWMIHGAPTGIEPDIPDPGIFPPCHKPVTAEPNDINCDEQTFQNYPNVENQDVTEAELQAHVTKGHVVAFVTFEELSEYFGGKPY